MEVIWVFGKPEYFCEGGLDRQTGKAQRASLICPSGKSARRSRTLAWPPARYDQPSPPRDADDSNDAMRIAALDPSYGLF